MPNLEKKQVYSISPKFVALLETGLIEAGKKKRHTKTMDGLYLRSKYTIKFNNTLVNFKQMKNYHIMTKRNNEVYLKVDLLERKNLHLLRPFYHIVYKWMMD